MVKDEIIVEYSEDKFAKAKTLSQALRRKGYRIEFRRVDGKGVLLFKINKLFYKESDYPYMVAMLIRRSQQRAFE